MEGALEQYLILAKTAKGKACEALIMQAISHPKTFVFGELLDAVDRSGISNEARTLLEIFTYGTLADFRAAGLPDLSPQQLKKIQMLTLASLASEKSVLSYGELLSVLEMTSTRYLEDLIIETFYEGLIKGKIDHKNSCLRVFECFGRDLRPSDLPQVLTKIENYVRNIEEMEVVINRNIEYLQINKARAGKAKEEFDKTFNEDKESIKACIGSGKEGESFMNKLKKQFNLGTN